MDPGGQRLWPGSDAVQLGVRPLLLVPALGLLGGLFLTPQLAGHFFLALGGAGPGPSGDGRLLVKRGGTQGASRMEIRTQTARTFSAAGPFAPCTTSNSTFWPSARDLKPVAWMAE